MAKVLWIPNKTLKLTELPKTVQTKLLDTNSRSEIKDEIDTLFDHDYYLQFIDDIYGRLGF